MTRTPVPAHDIVVEIYDGLDISMRCITCRERIAVRPESAAASLHELYRLADDHSRAALASPAPAPQGEQWECEHHPRCADAVCSYNPAMQRWIKGEPAPQKARSGGAAERRPCPHGCADGHTEDEYYGGSCAYRVIEPFEGWGAR